MTVEKLYYGKYIGSSTDDKPILDDTVALSVLPGEEFYEYDTYKSFIWDGVAWRELSKIIPTTSAANSTATGTIDAAGGTVECEVSPGAATVGCQLTGTWETVGNLIRFEGTTDGTTWVPIYTSMGVSAVLITGNNGIYQLGAAGCVKVRVYGMAGWTVGKSCIAYFNSSVGGSAVVISTPLPQGTNTLGSVSIVNGISVKTIAVDINATGTVIAAVATKKIKVYAVKLIVSAALSINFRDGAATNLEGAMPLTANAGYIESVTPPLYLFSTTAGNSLDLVIAGAGSVTGRISYWDSDAT